MNDAGTIATACGLYDASNDYNDSMQLIKHYTMDEIGETFIDFNDNMDPSVLV